MLRNQEKNLETLSEDFHTFILTKSRATEEDLETLNRRRNGDNRDSMGCSQDGSTESSAVESCCWGPMLHQEPKGISHVRSSWPSYVLLRVFLYKAEAFILPIDKNPRFFQVSLLL